MAKKRGGHLTPRSWAKRMLRQPPKGFYGRPSVYLCGDTMEIEHFRRVVYYEDDRLCLELGRGQLTVYGDDLVILTLAAHRVTLRGRILRTDYSEGEHGA